jgi:hypothetical protein
VIERGIYTFTRIDNKKQYKLWLCWQPEKPEPAATPDIPTPYPRKRVLKKEIRVKKKIKQKVKEEPSSTPAASPL